MPIILAPRIMLSYTVPGGRVGLFRKLKWQFIFNSTSGYPVIYTDLQPPRMLIRVNRVPSPPTTDRINGLTGTTGVGLETTYHYDEVISGWGGEHDLYIIVPENQTLELYMASPTVLSYNGGLKVNARMDGQLLESSGLTPNFEPSTHKRRI